MNVYFCSKTPLPIRSCKLHTHQKWELIYQLSGSNRSTIGNTVYEIQPGDVMLIPPGTPHDGVSEGEYTDLYIQAEELDFYDIRVIHDYDRSIRALSEMLLRCFWQKDANYRKICDALLETVCQYIKKYEADAHGHPFVYRLKNYICENVANPDFSAADMAAYLGYNIDYIRRSFHAETGKTPGGYLTDLRIALAKKLLLQETFVSVRDVAAKCGFSDSFYFSTQFRRKTGLSPTEYQKRFSVSGEDKSV